jgi:hypothetical protein
MLLIHTTPMLLIQPPPPSPLPTRSSTVLRGGRAAFRAANLECYLGGRCACRFGAFGGPKGSPKGGP